jgi:7 transmembrane receptor (rhodopsin family)
MDNITFSSVLIAGNSTANETLATFVEQSDETYVVMDDDNRDSLYLVIPITLIYGIIFITGCIGNISTCIVIARNKSMYSATNYYLFSLAVSDFILLISGVPMELYHIWYKNQFVFGESFCIIRNMINEMSANATVLTSELKFGEIRMNLAFQDADFIKISTPRVISVISLNFL